MKNSIISEKGKKMGLEHINNSFSQKPILILKTGIVNFSNAFLLSH
jgi:hypothetical protein